MPDREKIIKGLEFCTQHGSMCGSDCNGHYEQYTDGGYVIKLVNEYRSECTYGKCETGCVKTLAKDALELLKEQESKYGRWMRLTGMAPPEYHGHKICSVCGCLAPYDPIHPWREELSKYCPGCGAKMEGEVE